MPAPDLTPQTPGETLGSITPLSGTTEQDDAKAQPPLYIAKHIAGGRWHVVTNEDVPQRVGDFVGDKESILVEVARMNAGGEPFVQEAKDDTAAKAQPQASSGAVDPATLKQPVMTPDGWLCPEPPVKE